MQARARGGLTDRSGGGMWRPEVLACTREAEAGLKVQSGGKPKVAVARVIGKSVFKAREWRELDVKEMTESRSQSIGKPKMVFTVTPGPSAKESVIGAPEVSE